MEVEVLHARTGKSLAKITDLREFNTIADIKHKYQQDSGVKVEQQSFRVEQRGKALKDKDTLKSLGFTKSGSLYFKNLGPQVAWTTVFLVEYAGPLFLYLVFYCRPTIIYGSAAVTPVDKTVKIAAMCWSFHYAKRLVETVFVHRFSHATMPRFNLLKNCGYYWGFTVFVAYFVNHPLYTPPLYGDNQLYAGLGTFIFGELGNLFTHLALRDLRPPGSDERRIPVATSNPFTYLFNLVSCPNYTYEIVSWIGFSVLSQSLPAALFTLAGLGQMTIWAQGKHRNYKKEFTNYPRGRKAIIPFLI